MGRPVSCYLGNSGPGEGTGVRDVDVLVNPSQAGHSPLRSSLILFGAVLELLLSLGVVASH